MTLSNTILQHLQNKQDLEDKKLDRAHDISKIILTHELGMESLNLQNELIENRSDKELALELWDKKVNQINSSIQNINDNYAGLGDTWKTKNGFDAFTNILDDGKLSMDKLTDAINTINTKETELQVYEDKLREGFSKIPAMFAEYKGEYAGPEGVLNPDEFETMLTDMLGKAKTTTVNDPLAFLDISEGKGLREHYYTRVAPDIQKQLEYELGKKRELAQPYQITANSRYADIQKLITPQGDEGQEEVMARLEIKKPQAYKTIRELFSIGQGGTQAGSYSYDMMLEQLYDENIYSPKVRDEIIRIIGSSPELNKAWKQLIDNHNEATTLLGSVGLLKTPASTSTIDTAAISSNFTTSFSNLNLGKTDDDKSKAFDLLTTIIKDNNINPNVDQATIDDLMTQIGTHFDMDLDSIAADFNLYLNPRSAVPFLSTAQKWIDPHDISGSVDSIWDALSSTGDFTDDPDFAEDIYAEGQVSKKVPTLYPKQAIAYLPLTRTPEGTTYGQELLQERPGYNLARAFGGGVTGVDSPFYDALYDEAQEMYNEMIDQVDPWGWDRLYKQSWTEGQKFEMLENYYMSQDPTGAQWNEVLDKLYDVAEVAGKENIQEIITKKSGEDYTDLIKYLDLVDQRNK